MSRRAHGEGWIGQRADGRWEARLRLPSGQRRSFFGKTRKEIVRRLQAARRSVEDGLPLPPERQLVGAYLRDWLEGMARRSTRESTWERYSGLIKRHAMPAIGRLKLRALAGTHLDRLYVQMEHAGLAAATIRQMHAVLHKALNDARRSGFVVHNAADAATPPRIQDTEPRHLRLTEARQLLQAAEGDRLEALYVLALLSGARQGELFALKWDNVNLQAGILKVRHTGRWMKGKGWVEMPPKTAAGRRDIPVPAEAVKALRRHRAKQAEERLAAGPGWHNHGLVFSNMVGRPLHPSNCARRDWRPLLKRAGLPTDLTFHSLRHTFGTLQRLVRADPKTVSELMGHSHVSFTLSVYTHAVTEIQRQAVDGLAAVLQGAE